MNASYRIVVSDLNTSTTVTSLDVFGNSNVYVLKVANASSCHLFHVRMEVVYLGRCSSGIITSSVVTFDASKSTCNDNYYLFLDKSFCCLCT